MGFVYEVPKYADMGEREQRLLDWVYDHTGNRYADVLKQIGYSTGWIYNHLVDECGETEDEAERLAGGTDEN